MITRTLAAALIVGAIVPGAHAATTKPADLPPPAPSIPGAKEQVSLRIDRDVLDFFQADGPGWQERINAALRKVAGK